jgi:hypothetical protein
MNKTEAVNKFKAEFPDIAAALLAEGKASVDVEAIAKDNHAKGVTEGIAKGQAEGAQRERARIQAVHALFSPGHEKLIAEAMFDGQSAAGDVAQKIVAADNAARANKLDGLKQDGAKLAEVKPGAANLPAATDLSHLPLDERCRAKWDSDAAIRAEFTDLAAYTAYERAAAGGKIKILGAKTQAA